MEERLLLSYHGSALYTSDPLTLHEGGWLNDAVLGFYFEYLAHDVLASSRTVLFLKPALVQCLQAHSDIASHSAAVPRDMFKREIVFIPVNSCVAGGSSYSSDPGVGNGTMGGQAHWSLLVYVRRPKPAFHYFDSLANSNYAHALAVKEALVRLIRTFHRVPPAEGDPPLIAHSCPQQENGSDCGIFVVLFVDILARRFADILWRAQQSPVAPEAGARLETCGDPSAAAAAAAPTARQLPSIPSPSPSAGSMTTGSPDASDAFVHPSSASTAAAAAAAVNFASDNEATARSGDRGMQQQQQQQQRRPSQAKRRITLEHSFWWIDYGDLSNPNRARLIILSLIKDLCIQTNSAPALI
ncbi:SUMO1 sentrin specific peptidase 8 [Coemansia sp. RSA 2049]|nr:SUMO1 sentrin specific peptidase 8 [Coemansia sp. RSA 2049]